MKKWTIYLVHHSHTDIGYTHPQEQIKEYHVDFINQVIESFEDKKYYRDFRWTCENFWQIENFMSNSSERQKEKLITLMKNGKIDYSLNYLNMTELIDQDLFEEKIQKARRFNDANNLKFKTAMTADINGYSRELVNKFAKNGVKNLISCIHTHHGAHPFGKKPYLFNWETPNGPVITFILDHYHLGNEFFLCPKAGTTYLLDDNYYFISDNNDNLQISYERITKYLHDVENIENYDYNFVPVMISGVITDNGTPNKYICDTIKQWNDKYSDEVFIKLVTLDELFNEVAAKNIDLPKYSGDLNDWWADGVGSTPKGTKIFKDAQRKYNILKDYTNYKNENVLENLIMYAEHTWGHSASITNPYNTLVDEMMQKKQAYAVNAHVEVSKDLEKTLQKQGKISILPDRDKNFKIINLLDEQITTIATITIEHWESIEGKCLKDIKDGICIYDDTDQSYNYQVYDSDRGYNIEFEIKLEAKEERKIKIIKNKKDKRFYINHIACDKVVDFKSPRYEDYISNHFETDYFKLDININKMTISLFDKQYNRYINDENNDNFLKLLVTSVDTSNQLLDRKNMGRNRISTMSSYDEVKNMKFELLDHGNVFLLIRIHYALESMIESYVDIKLYKHQKKIIFKVNYLKKASKNIENIFFNFNLNKDDSNSLKLTKGIDIYDPVEDLLPKANNHFFLIGEEVITNKYKILSPDCALTMFGTLKYEEINLEKPINKEMLNFWLANNFWETNFYCDLSGYHSFEFVLVENNNTKNIKYFVENPLSFPIK